MCNHEKGCAHEYSQTTIVGELIVSNNVAVSIDCHAVKVPLPNQFPGPKTAKERLPNRFRFAE